MLPRGRVRLISIGVSAIAAAMILFVVSFLAPAPSAGLDPLWVALVVLVAGASIVIDQAIELRNDRRRAERTDRLSSRS
jgi:hypothetical protein